MISQGLHGPDCGNQPAVLIQAMCVHEHLIEDFICEDCRGAELCCGPCTEAGCMRCPIQLTEMAR
jgi:hypothetical protein